ncbi:MAG: biopolymer transporter ExbD [Isosphaeraceae bacterium]|nr:biopolymer transporter ExbD [Isosphaeraceae bacterium]
MSRPRHGPEPPEEVAFPVTPMLDMAFQLLAFFVLTFQAPARETWLDLYLPAAPAALSGRPQGPTEPPLRSEDPDRPDREADRTIRAEADEQGNLKALRLADRPVADVEALAELLRQEIAGARGRPVRIRIVADEGLRFEEAARIIGACSLAGVAAVHLAGPVGGP